VRKLLSGEIRTRSARNIVQAPHRELLEQSVRKYQNRADRGSPGIEEMIALAKTDAPKLTRAARR